eukprot:g3845.t1
MGDGTLLSAERPYVVACAYDSSGFSSSAPECVRLFSSVYEYQVSDVQRQAFLFFSTVIGWTAFNAVVLQRRVKSTDAVLLAGSEVSAVCSGPAGGLLDLPAEAEAGSHNVAGKDLMSFRENIFLPVLFKPKGSYIQFVLYDLDPQKKPIAFASITLSQALRSKGEQRMKLQPMESAKGSWPKAASGCLPWRLSPQIIVKFRYIEALKAIEIKETAKIRLEFMKEEIRKAEEQLDDLQKQKATLEQEPES